MAIARSRSRPGRLFVLIGKLDLESAPAAAELERDLVGSAGLDLDGHGPGVAAENDRQIVRARRDVQLEPKALADVAGEVDLAVQGHQRGRRDARVRTPVPAREYQDDRRLAVSHRSSLPAIRTSAHRLRLELWPADAPMSSAKRGSPERDSAHQAEASAR